MQPTGKSLRRKRKISRLKHTKPGKILPGSLSSIIHPGDDTSRDSYLLSGSDSSVILGGHGTNTNPNKKNYPGSDSSVMVERV